MSTFPSDLSAPGAVEQLLAAHRSVFGDLRMEANDDGGTPPADPPAGNEPPADPPSDPPEGASLEDVMTELGITPDQLKGRLEASKTWEKRAKANVPHEDYQKVKAELDELQQANESASEKAVREAREEGRTEARQQSYDGTAKALLRMGLKARGVGNDDLEEIVTQANLAAFADEDGDVDDEKISRYVERNAGTAKRDNQWPGTGQDRRGGGPQKSSGDDLWEKHYGSKKQ